MLERQWIIDPNMRQDFPSLLHTEPDVSTVVYKLPRGLPILLDSIFKNLKHLDISGAMVLNLPDSLAEHTPRLSTLNAGFNKIQSVTRCQFPSSLRVLLLHCNVLEEVPQNILQQTGLKTLNWDKNNLVTLTLPPSLTLRSISTLYLNGNALAELPSEISALSTLTSLNLKNNLLEVLPDSITTLEKLQVLQLSSNRLSVVPPGIGALTNLRLLNLACNRLATLPAGIGGLWSLEELSLEEQVLKPGLQEARHSETKSAVWGEADAGGTLGEAAGSGWGWNLPSWAWGLWNGAAGWLHFGQKVAVAGKERRGLWGLVSRNRAPVELAFALPQRIEPPDGLNKLELLSCFGNGMRALPPWVCRLRALKEVNLNGNRIQLLPDYPPKGEPGLGWPALEQLWLENNQLRALPGWLGRSPACHVLRLANNDLQELPSAIGNMVTLEVLDLDGNEGLRFPEPSVVRSGVGAIKSACRDGRRSRVSWPTWLVAVCLLLAALCCAPVAHASPESSRAVGDQRPLLGFFTVFFLGVLSVAVFLILVLHLTRQPTAASKAVLDSGMATVIEPTGAGYKFRRPDVREGLKAVLPDWKEATCHWPFGHTNEAMTPESPGTPDKPDIPDDCLGKKVMREGGLQVSSSC